MPRYTYIAKSQPHKTVQGSIEADSQQDAIHKLAKMDYFPISVKAEDITAGSKQGRGGMRKISTQDIVLFTRQLSTLVESGVNILNAVGIISHQTTNKYLKVILNDVASKVEDGKSLSESLREHPTLFSDLYTSMIHSAEIGGTIEESLKRLADFMEKELEFKNSIRAALTYPLFVFVVGTITIIVLLVFVIPKLVTMFEDLDQLLPLPTRILIATSGILRSYWWLISSLIGIFIFLLRRLYLKPEGRLFFDQLKLKTKIWGGIILKTEIGYLMRSLSLLISSGVPLVYSLDTAIPIVKNQVLRLELQKFKDEITSGASFSTCLKNSKLFPPFVTHVVMVGEESGRLENAFLRIATDYEQDVDRRLKTLSRLLEPTMILIIGLIVGFIVLSMLLPIFQINLIVR